MQPLSQVQPLFAYVGQVLKPVSYYEYQSFIRQLIAKIHLEPNLYSLHSFRHGGATSAFSSKVPGELIKVHGDWKSDTFLKYLEVSLEHRLEVTQSMVQALPGYLVHTLAESEYGLGCCHAQGGVMDHNGGTLFFFVGDWNGLALVLSNSISKNVKTRRATKFFQEGGIKFCR